MSCCNNTTGQVLVDPCSTCNEPSAENEALPSALENFISAFFGTVEKSVVNGEVVWTLPCQLNVGLENNPRQEGEGLACYFLRLFEAGIIGLTGPEGLKGDKGDDGKSGYSSTSEAVLNATDECPNIAVPVVDDEPYASGLYVFIPFAGYFLVNEVQDNVVYLSLVQLSTNAVATIPAGSVVVPSGPSGSQGAKGDQGDPGLTGAKGDTGAQGIQGDAGFSAQAELLSSFVQPSANVIVGWVTMSRELYAAPGQIVWIGGYQVGGYYEVLAAAGAQIQIRNTGDSANSAAGTSIPASSAGQEEWVVICGPRGLTDVPDSFSWKEPVRLVETSNLLAITGLLTVDGVTVIAGDRVLLTGQTNPVENGIYEASAGAWTRAEDADDAGDLPTMATVGVQEGTNYQHSYWTLHSLDVLPGTDAQVWNEFGIGEVGYAEGSINAGAVGITFSGASTWTIITNLSEIFAEGFSFASNQFTCEQAGRYRVDWSLSFQSTSVTQDVIHGGVAVNGTILNRGRASRSCQNSSAYGNFASSTIVDLSSTDTVELQAMNATDTDGITVIHASLTLTKVATA